MATSVKRGYKVIPVTMKDPGAVVVRGPGWIYNNQDSGALYGVVTEDDPDTGWCNVIWYNHRHQKTGNNHYEFKERFDLAYYNPDDRYGIPGKSRRTKPKPEGDELPGNVYPEAFVQWIINHASKETIHFTDKTLSDTYPIEVLYSIFKDETTH